MGKKGGDVEEGARAHVAVRPPPKVPTNPGFFSQLTFWFVDPLIRYGHNTTLGPSDLFKTPVVETKPLHHIFEVAWQKQLEREKPNIIRAVAANCYRGLIFTGLLYCISLASQLVGPMMLQRIVGGLQCWARQSSNPAISCPTSQDLYYIVIAICLAPLIQSFAENQMQFRLNIIGTRMRNGLMAAIFRKCLRLSNTAIQSESTGKVVTLMSNDAQKVQEVMLGIHVLWGAPCLVVVILVLLYQQVGWATFVGLGVVLAYTPLSTRVSRKLLGFRRGLLKWTDKRVGLMNEVINGMQMIKFYAWEDSFKSSIMEARKQEATILKKMVFWQGLFAMLLFSGPVAMAVFCFASYALAGQVFTASQAYTALALFNMLRLPLAFLPMMITALVNAIVAVKRIQDFLLKPEAGSSALLEASKDTKPGVVKVTDGDFTWDPTTLAVAALRDVNLEVSPGSLTMVVGGVGSGKSSLLSALIGQMDKLTGQVAVGGSVAYVAQVAWIINDSVQENIIMGEDFDPDRYRHAVEVSQLLPDLALLPNGDATEIGDRGVTLSGGQKQRVSIARAVYANADVYLLDDPLSAVDSHVGRALFEQVICGALRGKTIVLVTNALHYLPAADQVIWMDGGLMKGKGTYQQLTEQGLNIAELVHLEGEESDNELDLNDGVVGGLGRGLGMFTEEETEISSEEEKQGGLPAGVVSAASGRAVRAAAEDGKRSSEESSRDGSSGGLSADGVAAVIPPAAHTTAIAPIVAAAAPAGEVASAGVAGSPRSTSNSSPPAAADGAALKVKHSTSSAGGGARAPSYRNMRKVGSKAHHHASLTSQIGSYTAKGSAPKSLSMVRLAAEANRNLTGVEERSQGRVKSLVIWSYVAAAGGIIIAAIIIIMFAAEQAARVLTDIWLGFWTSNAFHQTMWFYVGVYAALGLGYSLITFIRSITFLNVTVNAALNLHNQLLTRILCLPKVFFDTNPAGRILNRFSRDVEVMDSVLNQSVVQFSSCFASYISILIVISLATKWFAIAVLPITIIYIILQRFYIPSARELQRIESISRSPIYSKFSEALAGVSTIRAFRKEAYFTTTNDDFLQNNAYAYVTQRAAAGWLALRLDMVGVCILTLAAVLCIQGAISPGLAGLCLVYALDLTKYLKHGTAMASKTESDFNSVERVVEYLEPPTEAAADTPPGVLAEMPKDWPTGGAISVFKLQLRYRPGLPLVLKGVSFEVAAGEKVGLVGRTGSGKSSLLLALFRMVEPEHGTITIDGVDIARLGLKTLRSAMSIIPQDPFMFSGTVRHNLDPFKQHGDDELWEVLGAVGLKEVIAALELKLEALVVDNGSNFSQGQKQLFCMARAMLRRSKVLMLDEATASVDPESDHLLQAAIRKVFATTTMLTIAHRLNTIMDADRVLVMDSGLVAENGEPHELLEANEGLFAGMVEQTGMASSAYLREVARTASVTRRAARMPLDPRIQSEVLGAPYMDRQVFNAAIAQPPAGTREAAEHQRREWEETRGLPRSASALGMGRATGDDPLGQYMMAPMKLERELSEVLENAETGDIQLPGIAHGGSGPAPRLSTSSNGPAAPRLSSSSNAGTGVAPGSN